MSSASAFGTTRGRRWVLAGNLTATMAVGPIPVFAVGALAPLLTAEFGLTRTQLGVLTPVAFGLAAIGAYAGGHLPDRFGPRRILVGLYAGSLVSLVVFAVAGTFSVLLVALAFSGIAMSLSNPVTNALIARLIEPGRRGAVMGLKQSGVPMGQFLAGAALPVGALLWGWRGMMLAVAVLPLAGIVTSLRSLPRDPPPVAANPLVRSGGVVASVWILSLYSLLIAVVLQAVGVYVSLYAFEEVGMTSTRAGLVVGVLGGVGIVARILWGRVAEGCRTVSAPLTLLAGLAALSVVGLLAAQWFGAWLVWLAAVGFGASAVSVNVVAMLATFRMASPETTGRATGVIVLGMYSGFLAGPPSFGAVTDALGSYTVAWSGAIGLCVVAMLVSLWLRRQGA